MRSEGFDMPDPDSSGQFEKFDKESEKFAVAYVQCADVLGSDGGKG